MGYTTTYKGKVTLNKPLDDETYEFLKQLGCTRRMKRNLPPEYGVEGEYFVEGNCSDDKKPDTILNYNQPPATQPGLWCQWVPTKNRMGIEWDGGEKFYEGPKWMDYIIHRILAPKGYVCNGVIHAQGEEPEDIWDLEVKDNIVSAQKEIMEASKIASTKKEDLPLLINEYQNKHYKLGYFVLKEKLNS